MLTMLALYTTTFSIDGVRPVPFNRITLDHARWLDGRAVVASFIAVTPAYTWRGQTIIGTAEQPDGSERVVYLAGERSDVEEGNRIAVIGMLRVIQHAAAFVDEKPLMGWLEVRIEGVAH